MANPPPVDGPSGLTDFPQLPVPQEDNRGRSPKRPRENSAPPPPGNAAPTRTPTGNTVPTILKPHHSYMPFDPEKSYVDDNWEPQIDAGDAPSQFLNIGQYITWAIGTANATLFESMKNYMMDQHLADLSLQHRLQANISSLEAQVSNLSRKIDSLQEANRTLQKQNTHTETLQPPLQMTQQTGKRQALTQNPQKKHDDQILSYKDAAIKGYMTKDSDEFTLVKPKKKKAPTPLIPRPLPIKEREIIIETAGHIDLTNTKDPAMTALVAVNDALRNCKECTLPPIQLARFTARKNIIFTTLPNKKASEYTPFLDIMKTAFRELEPTNARVNEPWTRFLLHGVPTQTPLGLAKLELETAYPTLKMTRPPRWLTTDEKRQGKLASSLVLTVQGSLNIKQIGTNTLILANRPCRLTPFEEFTPNTQCRLCMKYGHPGNLCKEDKSQLKCGVCAKNHLSKDHECTIPGCKQGLSCRHPPMECVNCGGPHRAVDPKCPQRPQLTQQSAMETNE